METTSKIETTSKMKIKRLPEILLDDFSTATPQLTLNRKCYQVSKPEMEFPMIDIIYAALPMRAQIERRHFDAKTTRANLYMKYWSGPKGYVKYQDCTRPKFTQP